MEKGFLKFKNVIKVLVPVLTLAAAFFGVAINIASAIVLDIDESAFFVDDSGTYKCFSIGNPNDKKIAIAWNRTSNNAMPSTLVVPASLNYTTTINGITDQYEYTVEAIAKGGFRYGTFSSITLPSTIKEIKEEAFAYCESISYFEIPYQVDTIEASTFLDCRNLTSIYFTGSDGKRKLGNQTITSIGDHAFDSCVSLKNFYCPSTVTEFGKSCFQKCSSLTKFFFPKKIENSSHEITNQISIGEFAFADCSSLEFVYFEENISEVARHAFADCKSGFEIHYTSPYVAPGLEFSPLWRNKYLASNRSSELIDIIYSSDRISNDVNYPGIRYTKHNGPIYLDCGQMSTPIDSSTDEYIKIVEYEAPFDTQEGYYEIDSNDKVSLYIPNVLEELPVKVIGDEAFKATTDNDPIKKIVFNSNLVQIQHKAFYKCLNIEELDFSDCENLKEVSYAVFQDNKRITGKVEYYNEKLRSIELPSCLEYVGDYAFYNFINIIDGISFNVDGAQSKLKVIGDYAFAINWEATGNDASGVAIFGGNRNVASFDLVLPKSLNDQDAATAKYKNSYHVGKTYNAIGMHAFDNRRTLRSVVMEDDVSRATDYTYTTSFDTDAFNRCNHVFYFRANQNLYYIGANTFKSCDDLLEVYLDSTKVNNITGTFRYPWGINDLHNSYKESLFMGVNCKQNCAIYVNGIAPKDCDVLNSGTFNRWNVEAGVSFKIYPNPTGEQYRYTRYQIPTYYNINWYGSNDVLYWNVKTKTFLTSRPETMNQYLYGVKVEDGNVVEDLEGNGIISIVKKSGGNYIIGHYYSNGTSSIKELDLSNISYNNTSISSLIDEIADEAFAGDPADTSSAKAPGTYVILPTSIVTIGERAFCRKSGSGVKIVTYKNGNTIVAPTDMFNNATYDAIKSNCESDSNYPGYCCLPPNVTTVKRTCFYNNKFKRVELNANLSFLGNSAFYSYSYANPDKPNENTCPGLLESITFNNGSSNSNFISIGNSLYYIGGGASKQILLSAPSNKNDSLSLDASTKAIGMFAAADTHYESVILNNGLRILYGVAFANNKFLTSVSGAGLGTLEYISAETDSSNEEVFDNTVAQHLDIVNYRSRSGTNAVFSSRYGAFINCTKLTTFDFTQMTSLKKIGWGAFKNDKQLTKMAESKATNFVIKEYNSTNDYTDKVNSKQNVLDLRNCTDLISICADAFAGCGNNIKYAILPQTNDTQDIARNDNHIITTESKMNFGRNKIGTHSGGNNYSGNSGEPLGKPFDNTTMILISESVSQAYANYGNATVKASTKPQNHYPVANFKDVNISNGYFYAEYEEDCYSGNTSLKYWTIAPNGDIVLFSNYDKAVAYLPTWDEAHPQP